MTQTPDDHDASAPIPQRRHSAVTIVILIAGASVLFLSTAAVIYYRWITMNEPNCVIVVDSPAALKGAEIAVDSVMFQKPLKMIVGENGRYSIPFFVDPGDYSVKVTMGGETQFETRLTLTRDGPQRGQLVNLTNLTPTTQPTQPAEPLSEPLDTPVGGPGTTPASGGT